MDKKSNEAWNSDDDFNEFSQGIPVHKQLSEIILGSILMAVAGTIIGVQKVKEIEKKMTDSQKIVGLLSLAAAGLGVMTWKVVRSFDQEPRLVMPVQRAPAVISKMPDAPITIQLGKKAMVPDVSSRIHL